MTMKGILHLLLPIQLWLQIHPVDSLHIPFSTTILTRSKFNNSTGTIVVAKEEDDLKHPMMTSKSQGNINDDDDDENITSNVQHHNICIMVEPSPFTYISGYANRFQQLLQYLHTFQRKKYHVNVITTEVVEISNPLPTTYQYSNTNTSISIHHCLGIPLLFYPTMSVASPYFWKSSSTSNRNESIASILRQIQQPSSPLPSIHQRIDLLHVSSPGFMLFYAIFYSRYYSIPLLMSYHTHLPIYIRSYIPNKIISPIIQWIAWQVIRIVHSFADLTVVTSPQIYEEFVKQYHIPRCAVWQKGIDTQTFHPNHRNIVMRRRMIGLLIEGEGAHRNRKTRDDNLFLMLYVGRLGPEKRLKALRDVLDQISEQFSTDIKKEIRLCFVGDGPQRIELEQYFEKYVQDGIVQFLGVLRGIELSQAYASSDIFVLPSDSETLGFVVMESMASGVPVVGVNAGGVPDLIDHNRTGLLVDPVGDIPIFVEQVIRLKKDINLRNEMSKNARLEMERWSWTESMTKLVNEQYIEARQNFHYRIEQRILHFCRRICNWYLSQVRPLNDNDTVRQTC